MLEAQKSKELSGVVSKRLRTLSRLACMQHFLPTAVYQKSLTRRSVNSPKPLCLFCGEVSAASEGAGLLMGGMQPAKQSSRSIDDDSA